MAREEYLFTSESVTEGHPDKIADQVSDAVLDAILAQDPTGRVACETLLTTGLVVVAGEITTSCYVDIPRVARETIRDVGYTRAKYGFDYETCGVITAIDEQSGDIAMGVDKLGAGDQGLMFGYACTETEELMPLPIMLAHKLCQRLTQVRKSGEIGYLRPDGKSQVTVRYADGKPVSVETVVISTQHGPDAGLSKIREEMIEHVVLPTIPRHLIDPQRVTYHINPTGRFVTGGPMGDTGLTGRKIIVDTYGGSCPHGGGAFSGKDPTKVDRSACYMARHVAKNIVAAGLAERAQVQVAYAIGVADPVSIMVETFGTGKVPNAKLEQMVRKHFDFTPAGIIKYLDLRRPFYRKTAAYGHFGRPEPEFTWERTNRAKDLRDDAGV
jgi:S-adenosylmethionine synthetase